MPSERGRRRSSGNDVVVERIFDAAGRIEMRNAAAKGAGSFDLRIAGAALAVVGNGRIWFSNARFAQLARLLTGELVPIEAPEAARHPDLRTLVLATAERMLRERTEAVEGGYRDTSSGAAVSVRFERGVHGSDPVVLVVAEDVTASASRDHELARSREAVLHRERLRVLGELAASIAHDLGNTLRGASFQLATLQDDSLPQAKRSAAVDAVAQRIEIASEAIARLHDFARTGSLGLTAVRLDRVVAQAAALVQIDLQSSTAPVDVRISIPKLPRVRGSGEELSLLFVNLLRNARDAMAEGGTVTITARLKGESVMVTVTDQGTGIPPEAQRRLFEPFFTTKGARGTGLGLWLAAGTMERLGGSIRAVNRRGRGTLFVLSFPVEDVSRAARSSKTRRDAGRRAPPAGRTPRAPRP